MTYVLSIRPQATAEAIQKSLARVRARGVALVFPFGQRAVVAEVSALRSLALYCKQSRREVAIIGGDVTLRALAVTAGFVAATTLEDGPEQVPTGRGRGPAHGEWEAAYARFAVQQAGRQTQPLSLDDDLPLDEPPAYVRHLVESHAVFATPNIDALPIQHSRRTTRKLVALAEEEAIREIYEADEDALTAAIRGTGGLSQVEIPVQLTHLPASLTSSGAVATGIP